MMSGGKFGNPKLEDSEAIERWKAPGEQVMNKEELAKLDRRVAEALGWELHVRPGSSCWFEGDFVMFREEEFRPSTNGQQAMDLAREHNIGLAPQIDGSWSALVYWDADMLPPQLGPTPELAICKAIIALKEAQ
jgi:hypothetical protein